MRLAWTLGVALVIGLATAPASGQDGWRQLFDGKTLGGWYPCNGTAPYTVENGSIVGRTVVN